MPQGANPHRRGRGGRASEPPGKPRCKNRPRRIASTAQSRLRRSARTRRAWSPMLALLSSAAQALKLNAKDSSTYTAARLPVLEGSPFGGVLCLVCVARCSSSFSFFFFSFFSFLFFFVHFFRVGLGSRCRQGVGVDLCAAWTYSSTLKRVRIKQVRGVCAEPHLFFAGLRLPRSPPLV